MAKKEKSSRIKGFYNLSIDERKQFLIDQGFLTSQDLNTWIGADGLPLDTANNMIENVIGTQALPVGIALNFNINGKDVLVPMVVEEPSVVAGASYMAKLARDGGGFQPKQLNQ